MPEKHRDGCATEGERDGPCAYCDAWEAGHAAAREVYEPAIAAWRKEVARLEARPPSGEPVVQRLLSSLRDHIEHNTVKGSLDHSRGLSILGWLEREAQRIAAAPPPPGGEPVLSIDVAAGAAYLRVRQDPVLETVADAVGVHVDFTETGELVGVEFSCWPPKEPPAAPPPAPLRALEQIAEFSKAHHGDLEPHVLLHALVVDIPAMVEDALAGAGPDPVREALRAAELIRAEFCVYSRPGQPAEHCDCKFVRRDTCGENTGCAEMRLVIGVLQMLVDGDVDILPEYKAKIIAALAGREPEARECQHEWVSTHNPPVVIGGELCRRCNAVRAASPAERKAADRG